MTRRPLVSVVVATRNQALFLRRCLRSLVGQSLPRQAYEIIVVDDASTDSTRTVLDTYRGEVVGVRLPRHRGLPAACNEGLRRARGQFVARVDSDDWLDRDALSLELAAFGRRDGVDIVLPDYWEVRGGGSVRRRQDPRNVFSWIAAGPMMRLSVVRRAGGYRPLFWEEYDLYLRLLRGGARPRRVARPLLFYRRHASSMTANPNARKHGWRELLHVWRRELLFKFGSHPELGEIVNERNGSQHVQNHRHRRDR